MATAVEGSLMGHKVYASAQVHAWEELSASSRAVLSLITNAPLKRYTIESILLS